MKGRRSYPRRNWEQEELSPYKSSNMTKPVQHATSLGLAAAGDGPRIVGSSLKDGQAGVVLVYDTAVSVSHPHQSPIESPIIPRSVESHSASLSLSHLTSLTASPTAIDGVQICQCGIQLSCVENYKQIVENELFICLRSTVFGRHVPHIRELMLRQGSKAVHRITNFTNDKHTWVTN